jgi:hypothetical protein
VILRWTQLIYQVLFYHSNCKTPGERHEHEPSRTDPGVGVFAVAEIDMEGYPDCERCPRRRVPSLADPTRHGLGSVSEFRPIG